MLPAISSSVKITFANSVPKCTGPVIRGFISIAWILASVAAETWCAPFTSASVCSVVLCCVTGLWEDGVCVVLCCVTGLWEDGVCLVLCCVTGVWEDGVCVVLCCVTGVWEDGVCTVLCCVAGVWEDDVAASPSPAGGKDANTASDKVAAVRFSAAVFFFLGGASGFVLTTTAFQMRDFVFIVTYSPIFKGPLTFFSLLILDAHSRYSFSSYLDDPLPSYLSRIFSII